ncbi:helix-turn-helix domain-containing protein [Hyphobacterium sp.]|uniref:helix-turn-helix domain-containing protein n=1 Tax=Hyphobacterium sp. TaxID=2004662 RepID=UPI003748694A
MIPNIYADDCYHVVNNIQGRLISKATTRHILLDLVEGPKSVSELVEATGLKMNDVYYKIRKLEAAKLIKTSSVIPRKGRPIKQYTAISKSYFVPSIFTPSPSASTRKMVIEKIEEAEAVDEGLWVGFDNSNRRKMTRVNGSYRHARAFSNTFQLYLSADTRVDFRNELLALLNKYRAPNQGLGLKPHLFWSGVAEGLLRDIDR